MRTVMNDEVCRRRRHGIKKATEEGELESRSRVNCGGRKIPGSYEREGRRTNVYLAL